MAVISREAAVTRPDVMARDPRAVKATTRDRGGSAAPSGAKKLSGGCKRPQSAGETSNGGERSTNDGGNSKRVGEGIQGR